MLTAMTLDQKVRLATMALTGASVAAAGFGFHLSVLDIAAGSGAT